ncbi:MAG TPA: hypothetical protein VF712_14125 [Thermoleophilaceae bacterium]|jgi:hypothetical protein
MHRPRRIATALTLACATALAVAACGGETTDVSGGVENLNKQLADQGLAASLDCPKEVDGGEGTDFECTLKGDEGGKEEKVQMQVKKEGDKLVVDVKDRAAWAKAIQSVAGQQGTGEEAPPEEGAAPEEETP